MAHVKQKPSIKQPVADSRITRKVTASVKASHSGSNTEPPVAPRVPQRGRGAKLLIQRYTALSAPKEPLQSRTLQHY